MRGSLLDDSKGSGEEDSAMKEASAANDEGEGEDEGEDLVMEEPEGEDMKEPEGGVCGGQLVDADVEAAMMGAAVVAVAIELALVMNDVATAPGEQITSVLLTPLGTLSLFANQLVQTNQSPIPLVSVLSIALSCDGTVLECKLSSGSTMTVGIADSTQSQGFVDQLSAAWIALVGDARRHFRESAHMCAKDAAMTAAKRILPPFVLSTLICIMGFDECDLDAALDTCSRCFRLWQVEH